MVTSKVLPFQTVFSADHSKGNFLMTDKAIFCYGLPGMACSVLQYMLSKPKSWKHNTTDIARTFKCGPDRIKTALRQLRQKGFVVLYKIILDNGSVAEWRYAVFEKPLKNPVAGYETIFLRDVRQAELAAEEKPKKPQPLEKSPLADIPPVDIPPHSNIDSFNNIYINQSENKTESNIDTEEKNEPDLMDSPQREEIINPKEDEPINLDWLQAIIDKKKMDSENLKLLEQQLKNQIDYDCLINNQDEKKAAFFVSLYRLMLEVLISPAPTFRINRSNIPALTVKRCFIGLTLQHLDYIADCYFTRRTEPNTSIKNYLLTCLYNAQGTYEIYCMRSDVVYKKDKLADYNAVCERSLDLAELEQWVNTYTPVI